MTWLQAGADSIGREVVVFLLACALSGSPLLIRSGTKFLILVQ